MNALAELFKAILKSTLCQLSRNGFLMAQLERYYCLITLPPLSALANAMQLLIFAVYIAVFILIPMVAFDIIFQIRSHLKSYALTRQEIKDEFKQQEGDPQLKARIRQQQHEMSRRRMMADVPKQMSLSLTQRITRLLCNITRQNGCPKVLAKGAVPLP